MVHHEAETNVFELVSTKHIQTQMARVLSESFQTNTELSNVRMGSINIDMMIEDLSRLDYIKELSDKWVLSNIVDSILMTPEFFESCLAEDVFVEAVLDEDSYQQVKLHAGK